MVTSSRERLVDKSRVTPVVPVKLARLEVGVHCKVSAVRVLHQGGS